MLQGPKDQPCVAAALFGGQCVLPLAAAPTSSTTYTCDARTLFKTRVWGSESENVHCSSATAPLKIELRWGCEECSEKTAVGSGVSFKYDPFGRRIYKSSSAGTSIFAYDGGNLIEETNSSGTVVARYEDTQNTDEPVAMLRSSTTSFYQADGLGSITSLSNAAGALAQTYTFDSFGKQTASSGSLTNPFQYTARELDTETGLYYYRARYYDPSAGRFLSEDPTMFEGGINFYDYVRNSPNNLVDQSGLDGHTWGPITFYTNQEGMSAAQINAEKAHEKQHRCDFWNGNVFTKPCEFLESRGFAAEIPILQQAIQQLQQQKTLTAAQGQELQQLLDELGRALALSDPKGIGIHYYCNPPSMSPNPQYPTPPRCGGFSCLDNR
jgi:RHS repeat-associated protein